MDYREMTAPCGLDCFNCHFYLAKDNPESMKVLESYNRLMGVPIDVMLCKGCRGEGGLPETLKYGMGKTEPCHCYTCTQEKGIDFCCDCDDFPCDQLHPYADRAAQVPHNTKVFNLCLIKKLGLEKWAESKAGEVRETYFTKWWTL